VKGIQFLQSPAIKLQKPKHFHISMVSDHAISDRRGKLENMKCNEIQTVFSSQEVKQNHHNQNAISKTI
jgi:hypothetical protein